MIGWDRALRSLVADAWRVRHTAESVDACARLVEAWELWPLVELELAIERAREELARRDSLAEAGVFAWYVACGLADDRELARV